MCDASRSSSFGEAFHNGTVLPYVLDSAFRSLEFTDISICSSFSDSNTRLLPRPDPPEHAMEQDDDSNCSTLDDEFLGVMSVREEQP